MSATPPSLTPSDSLDIALSEILGSKNAYAYSTIATIRRHLHSFRLIHQFEPHEILFEAYLRGKETQRQGEAIYNPHAWLKSTAFNIIRENSRKVKRQASYCFDDLEYCISAEPEQVLEKIDLNHQINLLYKALREFAKEDGQTAQLLEWRTIDQLSWEQITQRLESTGVDFPSHATLRQRVSRAKKRVRNILHGLGLPLS